MNTIFADNINLINITGATPGTIIQAHLSTHTYLSPTIHLQASPTGTAQLSLRPLRDLFQPQTLPPIITGTGTTLQPLSDALIHYHATINGTPTINYQGHILRGQISAARYANHLADHTDAARRNLLTATAGTFLLGNHHTYQDHLPLHLHQPMHIYLYNKSSAADRITLQITDLNTSATTYTQTITLPTLISRLSFTPASLALAPHHTYLLRLYSINDQLQLLARPLLIRYDLHRQQLLAIQDRYGLLRTIPVQHTSATTTTEANPITQNHRFHYDPTLQYSTLTLSTPATLPTLAHTLRHAARATAYLLNRQHNTWTPLAILPETITTIETTADLATLQLQARPVQE